MGSSLPAPPVACAPGRVPNPEPPSEWRTIVEKDKDPRLEEVQETVDEIRARLDSQELDPEMERTFRDPGTIERDKVDDAIVPPG